MAALTISEKILSSRCGRDGARRRHRHLRRGLRARHGRLRARWRSTTSRAWAARRCSIRRASSSRSITMRRPRRPKRALFTIGSGRSPAGMARRCSRRATASATSSSSSAGIARAGDLVIGADSHTVTCGALNCFAIGVGSSDLAAAMLTGKIWLRVPHTIRVTLTGRRPVGAGRQGHRAGARRAARIRGRELSGDRVHRRWRLPALPLEDRLVLSNLLVESRREGRDLPARRPDRRVPAEPGRRCRDAGGGGSGRAITGASWTCDLSDLAPRIALPHSPDHVVPLRAGGRHTMHMVFIGTCTGGRVVGCP